MVIVAILGYVLPAVKVWEIGEVGYVEGMQTYLWLVAAAVCQQTGRWRQACRMPHASGCPRRRMESCPEHSPAQSTSNTIPSSHLLHKAQAIQSRSLSSTKGNQHHLTLSQMTSSATSFYCSVLFTLDSAV